MARKGPKPSYRIKRLGDRYQLTAFPVVNRNIVIGDTVECGLYDKAELLETCEQLVGITRKKFTRQGNV